MSDAARLAVQFGKTYGACVRAYRGIRLPPGYPVSGAYNGQGGGQMVSVGSPESALHYAITPAGKTPHQLSDNDDIVLMGFDVRPQDISYDPYGDLYHLVLRPSVDLKQLPNYKEYRVPYRQVALFAPRLPPGVVL